ncbi:MAG: hypothetical protein ACKVOQ_06495 [Cyclobacteriaceae bacterium]
MFKYFALWLTLFISYIDCFSQRHLLMLEKKNKNKTVYYKAGDVISFKIIGNKSKTKGEIVELKDSVIVFKGYEVHINKIACLYIDEKTKWWLRYKIAQLSLIAGIGYLALDVINTGELKKETLIVSGTVIGVGLLAKLLISNKIKIRGKTKLRILKL